MASMSRAAAGGSPETIDSDPSPDLAPPARRRSRRSSSGTGTAALRSGRGSLRPQLHPPLHEPARGDTCDQERDVEQPHDQRDEPWRRLDLCRLRALQRLPAPTPAWRTRAGPGRDPEPRNGRSHSPRRTAEPTRRARTRRALPRRERRPPRCVRTRERAPTSMRPAHAYRATAAIVRRCCVIVVIIIAGDERERPARSGSRSAAERAVPAPGERLASVLRRSAGGPLYASRTATAARHQRQPLPGASQPAHCERRSPARNSRPRQTLP